MRRTISASRSSTATRSRRCAAADIADAIRERVGGKPTYLTFDIDCLDPAYAPGTGTPVAGGPSSGEDRCRCCARLDADRHRRRRRRRGCAALRPCRYHRDRRRDGGDALSRARWRSEKARLEEMNHGAAGLNPKRHIGLKSQDFLTERQVMKPKIFIDGEHGTTGLQIRTRLAARDDLAILSIPEAERRNLDLRAELLKEADVAILCLPDDASKEASAFSKAKLDAHHRHVHGVPRHPRLGLWLCRDGAGPARPHRRGAAGGQSRLLPDRRDLADPSAGRRPASCPPTTPSPSMRFRATPAAASR